MKEDGGAVRKGIKKEEIEANVLNAVVQVELAKKVLN